MVIVSVIKLHPPTISKVWRTFPVSHHWTVKEHKSSIFEKIQDKGLAKQVEGARESEKIEQWRIVFTRL